MLAYTSFENANLGQFKRKDNACIQNVVATPVIQTYEEELFGGADLNLNQLIRQSQLVLQPMVPRRVLGEVEQNLRMLNTIMNDPPDAYWCQNEQPAGDAAVTLTRVDPESQQAQAKTLIPAEPVQPGTINIADGVVLRLPTGRRPERVWPVDFTFPINSLTPHLRGILSDPLLTLRKSELKDLVDALFHQMLPITTL
jgi:hypothetical protein